eukprot:2331913-Lingulodinium_polyedra.AAC.1
MAVVGGAAVVLRAPAFVRFRPLKCRHFCRRRPVLRRNFCHGAQLRVPRRPAERRRADDDARE